MRSLSLLLLALAVGCGDEVDIPTPPSLGALAADYSAATGTLTAENAPAVLAALLEEVRSLEGAYALAELVYDLTLSLQGAGAGSDDGVTEFGESGLAARRQRQSTSAAAWARLTHICPGWEETEVDARWGRIQLNYVLDARSRDVVWGALRGCHLLTDAGERALYEGVVRIRLGEPFLIDFDGTRELDGARAPLDFDLGLAFPEDAASVQGAAALQRLEVDGARFIGGVGFGDDGSGGLVVVDAGGTWTCLGDLDSGTCERGGETVRW